ncbi:hypothetical protein CcaverHIS002_0607310 [Cutaneotrichosporon cavernicola]|uniref:Mid2 domain-containing protein n=1 Tax=Cutaneotrichosporon cavernicola TaxID=279322 RepID=A0AA48QY28_9TREE|nr:uncharacterized protein CcaverHIS019_0606730 [Cutaneotrichosporon cavernicola]BEI86444.1 hypothetical protein CcaverHIS002_0607310 [Cutaneotrichosporon cavernicola]BEI94214.1 hypothetical protein CcaverHIS019_0606730 [Cutaneotrichosporon cavernicola]BEJ01994.1 hypothetical protein CcaverHIS631_0606760 [Cutaneotrichosporon cavernicola]BEJ09757.1 hypothetical protein CcaverHIS641_0606720 [Cutaneotrichosporon cavernicola]
MRIALFLLPLALASIPPNHPARRHHAKLIARQNGTDTDTDTDTGVGPSSVTPSPSAPPTSSAAPTPSETPSASSIRTSNTAAPSSERPNPTSAVDDTSSADASSVVASSALTSEPSAASSARTSATLVTESDIGTSQTETLAPSSKGQTAASRTVVKTSTAKASATSGAAKEEEEESGGLPKGALIAIIVCSVVIGVGGIAWTLFRKWKLKPSKGFDQRMQPIDFRPGTDMGDDFFEKTMARDADAERQRQQFCIELDNDSQKDATLVGDIQHDFTAGPATNGYGYQPSPYGQDYDFSAPRNDWDAGATGYPPQPGAYYSEYPTQDSPDQHSTHGHGSYVDHSQHGQAGGYADLQRGSSVGHAPAPAPAALDFGADFAVSGRPTDSSAGPASPYAQAATYRY